MLIILYVATSSLSWRARLSVVNFSLQSLYKMTDLSCPDNSLFVMMRTSAWRVVFLLYIGLEITVAGT